MPSLGFAWTFSVGRTQCKSRLDIYEAGFIDYVCKWSYTLPLTHPRDFCNIWVFQIQSLDHFQNQVQSQLYKYQIQTGAIYFDKVYNKTLSCYEISRYLRHLDLHISHVLTCVSIFMFIFGSNGFRTRSI